MKTFENDFVMLKDSKVQQHYTLLSDLMKFLTQNNIVLYGSDWNSVGKQSYDHKNNKKIKPARLKKEMRWRARRE